jgi:hypothetical protein
MRQATYSKSFRRRRAEALSRIFAVAPTGMSIARWLEPPETFFDMIEAAICSAVSMPSGRSTEIITSLAGERFTRPAQTMHPPQHSTTVRISSALRSTRARTSIVSAVPAGEVMAREDVLGIERLCAATIGATMSDVRLPGMPPIEGLSTRVRSRQERRRSPCRSTGH